jgi:hypothetical protein
MIQKHGVKALLMGGQACVLYGAVEVTFDTDIAVLVDRENMEALRRALSDLQAERIAVPPFEAEYLERGLFVHFAVFTQMLAASASILRHECGVSLRLMSFGSDERFSLTRTAPNTPRYRFLT